MRFTLILPIILSLFFAAGCRENSEAVEKVEFDETAFIHKILDNDELNLKETIVFRVDNNLVAADYINIIMNVTLKKLRRSSG